MPKAGQKTAYRPIPKDFAETYVALGLNGTKAHYHAHYRTVARWIEAMGPDFIRLRRLEYMTTHGISPGVLKVWHRKRLRELSER